MRPVPVARVACERLERAREVAIFTTRACATLRSRAIVVVPLMRHRPSIVLMYSNTSERVAVGVICSSSAAAIAFLLWLLYLHHPPPELAQRWIFLPRLNAILNGLSVVALCAGLYFIKHRNRQTYRNQHALGVRLLERRICQF